MIIGCSETVTVAVTVPLSGMPLPLEFAVEFVRVTRKRSRKLLQDRVERLRRVREIARQLREFEAHGDPEGHRELLKGELERIEAEFDAEIRDSVRGWSGLPSVGGGEVEYSAEALAELLDHPAYYEALRDGMMLATGRAQEEAEGN